MPTVQLDLANTSLRISSWVNLHSIRLTIQINQYTAKGDRKAEKSLEEENVVASTVGTPGLAIWGPLPTRSPPQSTQGVFEGAALLCGHL